MRAHLIVELINTFRNSLLSILFNYCSKTNLTCCRFRNQSSGDNKNKKSGNHSEISNKQNSVIMILINIYLYINIYIRMCDMILLEGFVVEEGNFRVEICT